MIFLDDKPLEYYGLHLLKGHSHPSPSITNKTIKVPGRAGLYHFGNEIGARPFNHPVGILEGNPIDTQQKLRNFMTLLFDGYGKTREIKLSYDYEPDKYYTVVFDGSIDPQRIFEYAEFNLPLVSYDPYAYSLATAYDQEPSNYDSGVQYDSGLMYENYDTFNWNNTRQYFGNYNHSYYATKPKITIQGAVVNPRITNIRTGKWIQLPSLSDSDTLVVDFNKFTILKNNQNAFMQYKGDFFDLETGEIQLLFEGKPILKDATWGSEELTFEYPFLLGTTDEKVGAIVTVEWLHRFM